MSAVEEFDYVVVGAGSAGCVLAARLSADGRTRVLLLEAGGSDRRFWIRLPIGYGRTFFDERVNWKYETEPDAGTGGRSSYWPRGRVLGGSSSINAMVWCRGLPADFEDWRAAGNIGWGWDEVRAGYERIERRLDAAGRVLSEGDVTISDVSAGCHPLSRHYFAAAEEMGLAQTDDFNGDSPEGVGLYRITTRDGYRCSAADAFLRPVLRRANLRVQCGVLAERVLFDGRRAVGVEYSQGGRRWQARARAEVILSAGTVSSPLLLQRSGVGPGEALQSLGIPLVLEQPRVGENLQDHLGINYYYKATEPTLNNDLAPLAGKLRAALRYVLTRRGPLSLSVNQCGGFVRSAPGLARADLQLYFNPLSYQTAPAGRRPLMNPDPWPGFILCFQPCRPASRGRVLLRSPALDAAPRIEPNYLSAASDIDDVLAGARFIRQMARTRAMRALIAERVAPDLETMDDEQMVADFRARCGTVFHPVGSCGMGPDASCSVVDTRLRVHGTEALRVVDASVFPSITSGNTNAPTMMVATLAADAIIADRRG